MGRGLAPAAAWGCGWGHPNRRGRELQGAWPGEEQQQGRGEAGGPLTAGGCGPSTLIGWEGGRVWSLHADWQGVEEGSSRRGCDEWSRSLCLPRRLRWCRLLEGCCAELASLLAGHRSLARLELGDGTLGDSGVRLLCEGLRQPGCPLCVLQ